MMDKEKEPPEYIDIDGVIDKLILSQQESREWKQEKKDIPESIKNNMARPIKSGLDYFTHDTDASGDEKVESLMLIHGAKGYAFYFILLERIYRTDFGELRVTAAETMPLLCRKMYVTIEEFQNMLTTALEVGCFDKLRYEQDQVLTSSGIKKRYENVIRNRLRKRTNIVSPAETTELPGIIPAETTELGAESKVNESKVNESKVNEKEHIPDNAFDVIWNAYPNKDGKKAAYKHFKASVKTTRDMQDISRALNNYLANLRANSWKQPKNGSTWFNNWRDWIEPEKQMGEKNNGNGSGNNSRGQQKPQGQTSSGETGKSKYAGIGEEIHTD